MFTISELKVLQAQYAHVAKPVTVRYATEDEYVAAAEAWDESLADPFAYIDEPDPEPPSRPDYDDNMDNAPF